MTQITEQDLLDYYAYRPCDDLFEFAKERGASPREVQNLFDGLVEQGKMHLERGYPRVVEIKGDGHDK